MIPGPTYFYKCPNCGNSIYKDSLASGNTFGAELFSDGKQIAPMLPDYPDLTKCKDCQSIFWLSKLKPFAEAWDDNHEAFKSADEAKFLSLKDYHVALKKGVAETDSEESFIRTYIWWGFNDRTRKTKDIFKKPEERDFYQKNCIRLIELIEPDRKENNVMLAELNRNIGRFEKCVALLEAIEGDGFDWIKEILLPECEKKNQFVVRLR